MTDKEKYEAVINYIKGVVNGHTYICPLDIAAFNDFVKSLNK